MTTAAWLTVGNLAAPTRAEAAIAAWLAAGNLAAPLQIRDSDVVTLPPLPATVRRLECRDCTALRALGKLSDTLDVLRIERCPALAVLPRLPATLVHLICDQCQLLTTLGKLPASLGQLCVYGCPALVALPVLPATMTGLFCDCLALCPALRLPDTCPARLTVNGATGDRAVVLWSRDVAARHADDRRRVAAALPPAALLYV